MFADKRWILIGVSCVFTIGFFLGGIIVYFFNPISAQKLSKVEDDIKLKDEIMSSYTLLHQLRNSNIDVAINILEMKLNVALYTLSYRLENKIDKINAETLLVLRKIREYRKKYPNKYLNEENKQKIETLLNTPIAD
jgi:hypothetical protein